MKRKAQERLLASVDWLMVELLKIARSSNNEGIQLQAIKDALDRAGMGAKQVLELHHEWDDTFEGAVWGDAEWEPAPESDETATLRAEVSRLRKLNARAVQPELPPARPPARVDDRPSGPLTGRVMEPDEPWPPER